MLMTARMTNPAYAKTLGAIASDPPTDR